MPSVELLLLTQEQCSYCDDAKGVLDRVGSDYPITVRSIDIASAEGRQHAARGGVMFPPGLFLDGDPFSYGRLSERKLRKALDRKLAAAG